METIKMYLAGIATSIGATFGSFDLALKVLIGMIIFDVVTGLIKAFYNAKLNSTIGRQGISRKVLILVMVAVGSMLDLVLQLNILKNTICVFYIAVEGISILENIGQMGLPLPKGIKERLAQLKEISFEKKVE